jgi:hypothetical protein
VEDPAACHPDTAIRALGGFLRTPVVPYRAERLVEHVDLGSPADELAASHVAPAGERDVGEEAVEAVEESCVGSVVSVTLRPRPSPSSKSPSPSVSTGERKPSRHAFDVASGPPHSTATPGRLVSGVSIARIRTV